MPDYGIKRYRLNGPLLRRALLKGFVLGEDGVLRTKENGPHQIFLPGLDSAETGCSWGRLSMRCGLGSESMITIRAFASDQDEIAANGGVTRVDSFLLDPNVPREGKERLFTLANGMERTGVQDVLLDGQTGRWLWIWLEISGPEEESTLEDLRVYIPGDNFFRTFPQVYQNNNDFLRRYLSIFSTMYQEFQEKIDELPNLLDVDTAPARLLPMFASWLGLETDEALFTLEDLRRLLKAAPELLAGKGTRHVIEKLVRLFVSEPVYIVERNLLKPDQRQSEELYGSTPYDFTVMLGRKLDEKLRMRLNFLINQFKPVRSRCRVIFLEECGGLDSFTYMDINGSVLQNSPGSMDDGNALTGMTYLE